MNPTLMWLGRGAGTVSDYARCPSCGTTDIIKSIAWMKSGRDAWILCNRADCRAEYVNGRFIAGRKAEELIDNKKEEMIIGE